MHVADGWRRRGGQVLKDVTEAVRCHRRIEHKEGRSDEQGPQANPGDQQQSSDQRQPGRPLGARPQRLSGRDAGEDEGAVVLQARRDAETHTIEQQRSRTAHGRGPIGNVESDSNRQRERNVEHCEVAVANMEKRNRQGRRRKKATQPAVGVPAKLEGDQYGKAA